MIHSTDERLHGLPPGLRSELKEAAWNHGYRRHTGEADGWLYFGSDINVPGEIGLAVSNAGLTWFLAVSHAGVAAELGAVHATPVPNGMRAAFAFDNQADMRRAIHRAYDLASSLPTAPLYEYQGEVAGLGDTEVERLTRQRIGQDIFRAALMRYWDGRCPLTGITDPALLRASHILPWAECGSDADRLDVHNGLLLAAHWDAAFDAGLVSFDDEGAALFSPALSAAARTALSAAPPIPLTPEHRARLAWHRSRFDL
jgi:hypothetical protein